MVTGGFTLAGKVQEQANLLYQYNTYNNKKLANNEEYVFKAQNNVVNRDGKYWVADEKAVKYGEYIELNKKAADDAYTDIRNGKMSNSYEFHIIAGKDINLSAITNQLNEMIYNKFFLNGVITEKVGTGAAFDGKTEFNFEQGVMSNAEKRNAAQLLETWL